MANLVGSTELPEETTKTSSATKSLHKMETPITKQLYRHYKPTHMKPQEGEGKKKGRQKQGSFIKVPTKTQNLESVTCVFFP